MRGAGRIAAAFGGISVDLSIAAGGVWGILNVDLDSRASCGGRGER